MNQNFINGIYYNCQKTCSAELFDAGDNILMFTNCQWFLQENALTRITIYCQKANHPHEEINFIQNIESSFS